MSLKEPASMEECVYFTNRAVGTGKIKAWVFRENCPKCGKGVMGKPKDEKTGKPKIRAEEYACPECSHTIEKQEYEDTLTTNIKYTCPHCSHQGEAQQSFKRKKIQRLNEETGKKETVEAIRFQCEKCRNNIDITKKMK
ncbi:hypothetical protein HYV89_03140 [Candidatus Woesearchaeota archaeon]|nr:hypothetical protein [Candidatus Woesearchaeota archaeon]